MPWAPLFTRRRQSVVIIAEQQALLLGELMREDWSSFRTRAVGTDVFYAANTDLSASAGSGITPLEDVLHLVPLIAPRRSRLAEFGVFRSVGVLAQNGRFGVYRAISKDNLYPGPLLFDSGVVSVPPASAFASVLPNLILEEGELYWASFVRQEDLGSFTLQAWSTTQNLFAFERARPTIASVAAANVGLLQIGVGGALPNPFPAGATRVASAVATLFVACRYTRV